MITVSLVEILFFLLVSFVGGAFFGKYLLKDIEQDGFNNLPAEEREKKVRSDFWKTASKRYKEKAEQIKFT